LTVQAFRLYNFMAFEDTNWIELNKICLIFGSNSSGKTAIIRGLRLLRQSLDCGKKLLCFSKVDDLDLGSFINAIHHDANPDITDQSEHHHDANSDTNNQSEQIQYPELGFGFNIETKIIDDSLILKKIEDFRKIDGFFIDRPEIFLSPDSLKHYEVSIGFTYINNQITLQRLEISFVAEQNNTISKLPLIKLVNMGDTNADFQNLVSISDGWWFKSTLFKIAGITLINQNGFLPSLSDNPALKNDVAYSLLQKITDQLMQEIREFLQSIYYLGPIRPDPRRVYALDNLELLQWSKQDLMPFQKFLAGPIDTEDWDNIIESMNELKLCQNIRRNPGEYFGGALVSRVEICDRLTGVWNSIKDIGYGFSQVLPIIATGWLAKNDALIIIEQPELHLHPRAQMLLMNFFVKVVNTRNYFDEKIKEESKVSFLLETHSEHILLRLRRCIAETTSGNYGITHNPESYLLPKNIVVHFIDNGKIIQLDIDIWGNIIKIPDGFRNFFADDLKDIVALSEARLIAQNIVGGKK
jgi:AAA15 family ATPase/GTPase